MDNELSGPRTVQYGTWDSCLSLGAAFFVNAAILILAAAAFHYGAAAKPGIAGIADAYELLAPALGSHAARILFGVALLACGQNSAITGTLAGQARAFVYAQVPFYAVLLCGQGAEWSSWLLLGNRPFNAF